MNGHSVENDAYAHGATLTPIPPPLPLSVRILCESYYTNTFLELYGRAHLEINWTAQGESHGVFQSRIL